MQSLRASTLTLGHCPQDLPAMWEAHTCEEGGRHSSEGDEGGAPSDDEDVEQSLQRTGALERPPTHAGGLGIIRQWRTWLRSAWVALVVARALARQRINLLRWAPAGGQCLQMKACSCRASLQVFTACCTGGQALSYGTKACLTQRKCWCWCGDGPAVEDCGRAWPGPMLLQNGKLLYNCF